MENENFEFENEELNENVSEDIAEGLVSEEILETEETSEEITGEFTEESTENSETIISEQFDEETEIIGQAEDEEVELSEEELEQLAILKKMKFRKNMFRGIIVLAVVLIVGLIYSICAINGVGSKTVVNTPLPSAYTENGKLIQEDLDIKFESPFVSIFSGKNPEILKVNGYGIDKDLLSCFVNNSALDFQLNLYQTGAVSDFSDFDWNEVDEKTGLTKAEIVKGETVKSISSVIAVIAEGKKRGVTLSEEDEKGIVDWIEQLKASYGENVDNFVKQNGFDSLEQIEKYQKFQMLYKNCYNAFTDDPFSYIKIFKNYESALSDEKISVKHVLIKFPEGITSESTEEEKAETKKKATEVLNKAKAGEDFSDLVFDYGEDPGQAEYGYTFANDGSMVQAFADASFALKVDEISNLVETPYGYHIIKRIDRVPDFQEYIKLSGENMKIRLNIFEYSKLDVNADITPYIQPQVTPEPTAVDTEEVSE